MTELLEQLREALERAQSLRRKGDALRKAGREDQAYAAWEEARLVLAECAEQRDLPGVTRRLLESERVSLKTDEQELLKWLVEFYGVQGGIEQRLNKRKEAFASYSLGARLEDLGELPATYNRLNAVKALILTKEKTLADVRPSLDQLVSHIRAQIKADEAFGESGWAYADLGDCLALLGKPSEALRAYSTFVEKAEIKSPERALDVLRTILATLEDQGDPGATELRSAVSNLESALATS
jgi:tetratricopeptide (TPR) repeat protein